MGTVDMNRRERTTEERGTVSGPPPSLRVCAKTSAGQEAYFNQNVPHPDPLPSDGRGNSQARLSQLAKRLHTPTHGGRFSLSHRMGEGRAFAAPKRLRPRRRGEGASKSEVVFARVLSTPFHKYH